MRAWLAAALARNLSRVGVRLRVAKGPAWYDGPEPAIGELVVSDVRTLLGLVFRPDLYFGEAYTAGRLRVRGNLKEVVEAVGRLSPAPSVVERIANRLAFANTLTNARRNVQHHYDLGNDFYRSWLDPELVYTCAYYAEPEMSLAAAQTAKLDLVCRKLRLRPGETVVEAGCGWGALALHMARIYGARVKAYNVSREQIAFARERAAREGLAHQVEFIDDDYRNVQRHVRCVRLRRDAGARRPARLRHSRAGDLADGAQRRPRPVALHRPRRAEALNAWIRRRIFPGAYTPTLGEVMNQVLMPAGMSVLDVENLRLHYARTLRHWAERFARTGDRGRRAIWRGVPPLVGAVPRGVGGRVRHGQYAVVPGRVHPVRLRAALLEPCGDLRGRQAGAVAHCDAVIVGGGPAGSTCARVLRRAGWSVVVFDRARFPRDKVCAGWVTPGVFRLLELDPEGTAPPA